MFDGSTEETDFLKVMSEARAKPEHCVVPSMPCIPKNEGSVKTDAMPIFERSGKPEAMSVSRSAGTEKKTKKHMDHISEKNTCPNSIAVWCVSSSLKKKKVTNPDATATFQKLKSAPAESETQVRSGSTSEEGRDTCSFRIPHGPLPS